MSQPDAITFTIAGLGDRRVTIKIGGTGPKSRDSPPKAERAAPFSEPPALAEKAEHPHGAPPSGACVARQAEAVIEGAASPLAIRCPEHDVPPGEPCPSESKPPVGSFSTTSTSVAAEALAELEALAADVKPAEADPDAPFVGQVRAHHEGDDSPRVEVVEVAPKRPGAAKLRTVPPEGMDAATIAATEQARTVWADKDQVSICWPFIVRKTQTEAAPHNEVATS